MPKHEANSLGRLFPLAVVALAGILFENPIPADENDEGEATAIADVQHEGEVDFERQVLPIFRRKCLACHNNTDAESDLVLETPQAILKGGAEGPAVVAGKSAESLLLILAARQEEPYMPPEDNEVGAEPLTPEELGWIKLWIDQGAKGEVSRVDGPVQWQPLPAGINPIYAVAISPDGQYAAAGRANQIFLHHVPSKREVGRLTDPSLLEQGVYKNSGIAHLDLVQSLRFSPDSSLLVSGGYRTVKFWQRARNVRKQEFTGLEGPMRSLAVSHDGKWAAFGEASGKIKLYELANNALKQTLEGHAGAVSGLAFSQDSGKLITGSQDKTIRVWNVADGKQVAIIETPAPVNAVAFVSEDQQLAAGGADHVIRVWALPQAIAEGAAPQPVKEMTGHSGPVTSLAAVPPNGGQLLSGGDDQMLRVWDVAAGNQIAEMNHGGPVTAVAVRPDGQRFASASSNNIAKLWNAADSQEIAELRGDFRAKIRVEDITLAVAVAQRHVNANKGDLDAANTRKEAEEKNVNTAEENRQKAAAEINNKVESAKKTVADQEVGRTAIEDAKQLVTKYEDDKKSVDEATKAADEAIKNAQAELAAADKYINDAPAATQLAADTLADGLKKLEEAAAREAENKALADVVAAFKQLVQQQADVSKKAGEQAKTVAGNAVADAQNKKQDAEANMKKAGEELARAQNDVKQKEEDQKKLDEAAQKAMDEQNDAERKLQDNTRTADRTKEALKKVVDTIPLLEAAHQQAEEHHQQTQALLETVTKEATDTEKPYHAIAFSADGRLLATGGDDQVARTWESEAGAAVEIYAGHGAAITAVAYTADGDLFSAAANQTAIVWDSNPAWKLVRTIGTVDSSQHLSDRVTSLDFSPDGLLLATGSGEPSRSGELKIWNVEDGSLVKEIMEAHSDTVFGVEFSPDGKHIASCGADRFAKIFDVESGNFIRAFEGHTHHVLGVTWQCDGRLLATSGADNVIKVWNVRTGVQTRTIGGFDKEVTAVRFVAASENVVASSGDKRVKIKKTGDGGDAADLGGATDFMYAVDVSANGQVVVGGGHDSVFRIWKGDGTSIVTFEVPKPVGDAETISVE